MRKALLLALAVLLISTMAFAGDPPARVARLSYLNGEVSIQPNGVNDWVQASINRPLTSSDRVWADKDARAELQLGGAALRVDSGTSMTLVNVSDNNVQVQLDEGHTILHVVELFDGEVYEVDTPNVSFIVRKKGDYRFDVDNAGDTTAVTVFKGEGDATGEGPAIRIKKEQRYTFSGGKSLKFALNSNPGLDGFDQWAIAPRSWKQLRFGALCLAVRGRLFRSRLQRFMGNGANVWRDLVSARYRGWLGASYRYGHWVWVGPSRWTNPNPMSVAKAPSQPRYRADTRSRHTLAPFP